VVSIGLPTAAIVLVMLLAAGFDLLTRRIPNPLVLAGLLAALALRAGGGGGVLLSGLAGAGLALAATFPLFALRGVGGGDVKLFAVAGAFLGGWGFVYTLIVSGLIGGVMGLLYAARRGVLIPVFLNLKDFAASVATLGRGGQRVALETTGAVTVPYGAAIAAGALVVWFALYGGAPW
jgi:prepilin peptidase CpaA